MSNKAWTWFKKVGHWIAVGTQDIQKFEQAAAQSGVLSLIPGGQVINTGFGILEKIFSGNTQVQITASTLGDGTLTNAQKLLMATPTALKAFNDYAASIGMKVSSSKSAELQTIVSGVASFGADFLNLLEPIDGDKLPVPNTPPVATPAAATAPKP